jgi:hypothetical protein
MSIFGLAQESGLTMDLVGHLDLVNWLLDLAMLQVSFFLNFSSLLDQWISHSCNLRTLFYFYISPAFNHLGIVEHILHLNHMHTMYSFFRDSDLIS